MKHYGNEYMNNSRKQTVSYRTCLVLLSIVFISLTSIGCESSKNDLSGTIKVSGSSTMSNLISLWCKGFSNIYHNTNCMVESFGSIKAPDDLQSGKVDIGAMSEPMSDKDKQDFKNVYGYIPLEIKVAQDMIAVLVNAENPITCITISELDGIYSNSNSCKGSTNINTWGELNLDGQWADTPISVYGRTPLSATYYVFRKVALCGGTYKKSVTELASSRDIVDFVARDTTSIGYSGSGILGPGVKSINVGDSKDKCYPPQSKYAASKQYPFTRDLYLYLKEDPKSMKKTTREFLKYVLSKQGQKAVIESGLNSLPSNIISEQKNKLSN